MRYDLDIAVAYLCILTLVWYVASWAVPRLFHSAVSAIVQRLEERKTSQRRQPRQGEPEQLTGDWWGPTHHSQ